MYHVGFSIRVMVWMVVRIMVMRIVVMMVVKMVLRKVMNTFLKILSIFVPFKNNPSYIHISNV